MKNRGIQGKQGVQTGVQIELCAMPDSAFHWRNQIELESIHRYHLGIQANFEQLIGVFAPA